MTLATSAKGPSQEAQSEQTPGVRVGNTCTFGHLHTEAHIAHVYGSGKEKGKTEDGNWWREGKSCR